jgi:5'-methylthioadenosine/S-adenosylhomocysteine nucleosidase
MPDWSHELPPLPTNPARVLLFIAMESEATPIAQALRLHAGRGRLGSAQIELCNPGRDTATSCDRIGPVYAAWALTRVIATAKPDLVVNMGTAGGFAAQGLDIADLVVARDTMFHDARVALAGFDAVARAHTRLSPHDTELDALAEAISARVGLVSSGSSLDATSDELAQFAHLRTLAKDMELAALAAVCATEQVPLIALKGVTDLVDRHEPAHEAFVRNLARTSGRLADAAPTLLRAIVSR